MTPLEYLSLTTDEDALDELLTFHSVLGWTVDTLTMLKIRAYKSTTSYDRAIFHLLLCRPIPKTEWGEELFERYNEKVGNTPQYKEKPCPPLS